MITTESTLEVAYLRFKAIREAMPRLAADDQWGRRDETDYFDAERAFLLELRKHPGIHNLNSVRYRTKLAQLDQGVYSLEFSVSYAGESFVVDQELPWRDGLRVRLSEDGNRHIEVIRDNAPIVHLPKDSQILIQLGDPVRYDSRHLVGHWIPELIEDIRRVRLPYIPVPLSDLASFPPPIVRNTEIIR